MLNVDSVLPATSCELLLLEFTSAGADDRDGDGARIQARRFALECHAIRNDEAMQRVPSYFTYITYSNEEIARL